MPSAHRPIFCSEELREKVGVKVRLFLGLSQCTMTDFLSELLCVTIACEVPLLDDITPIFYRTEVSVHGPIFCRKQLRETIGAILYRSKSQRTQTDFPSDFSPRQKNRSVCAKHRSIVYNNGIVEVVGHFHPYIVLQLYIILNHFGVFISFPIYRGV